MSLEATLFTSAGAILALAGLLLLVLAMVTKEEYVDPPYVPRHLKMQSDILADLDFEVAIELTTEVLATPVTIGRRAIGSPVRHMPVSCDWVPPVGHVRIAILDTPTGEYLFVRRPKDQLNTRRTRYVDSYVTAG